MEYIAFDAHKRYTQVSVETVDGVRRYEGRIAHARGALQQFLTTRERGSPVALETVGNWYWIVDEIEAAGQIPQLVHARKAKLMLGMVNKTDKLDARGLNRLPRPGTLPRVAPARASGRGISAPAWAARAHRLQEPDPCHPGQGPGSGLRAPVPRSGAAAARGSRRRSLSSRRTAGTRRSASLNSLTS
jgi:hypothetical protein